MRLPALVLLTLIMVVGCSVVPVAEAPVSEAAPVERPVIGPDAPSGMSTIDADDLPPEAGDTLQLIDAGGPFPYRLDGAVFQNREGLLPDRPSGYYREYTVDTPGSEDRGARRIVTGGSGEAYWTDDHYDSFAWIAR